MEAVAVRRTGRRQREEANQQDGDGMRGRAGEEEAEGGSRKGK